MSRQKIVHLTFAMLLFCLSMLVGLHATATPAEANNCNFRPPGCTYIGITCEIYCCCTYDCGTYISYGYCWNP